MTSMEEPVQDVLDFWFGNSLEKGWPETSRENFWFKSDPAVDEEIRQRFGSLVDVAVGGELVGWESTPFARLALILLLDQFPRNIWRGKADAYRGDHRAITLTTEGMARGMDEKLPWVGRVFFCMPLMHAEDVALQMRSVGCYERMVAEAPQDISEHLEHNLAFAEEHRDIILRFGRFPHRNAVLGRENTEEERDWLLDGNRYGQ